MKEYGYAHNWFNRNLSFNVLVKIKKIGIADFLSCGFI